MSDRKDRIRTLIWAVRPVEGNLCVRDDETHVFAGTEQGMQKHINDLHLQTGKMHAARIVEKVVCRTSTGCAKRTA